MSVIDEIHHLEKEFALEETREEAFRTKVLRGFEGIEDRFVGLEKKLVPVKDKAKAARTNLIYSMLRVFLFAFLASFVPFVTGIGAGINNMDAAKAAAWAAAIAGLAAVLKFVQACVTKDEAPFLDMGIFEGKKTS